MDVHENAKNGKPPLVISSEAEFEALMENIDHEMVSEGIKITARPFMAGIKITERYDVVLNAAPPRRAPKNGCFDPLEISIRIHEWVERRYGEKCNIPFQIGRVAMPFRGDFYVLNCPKFFGEVLFVCDPQTLGQHRETISRDTPPTCNIVDLIEGCTPHLAASFTAEEVVKLAVAFTTGMAAYSSIRVIEDVEFVHEAIGDLDAAVSHLTEHTPQTGLSKWATLQAVEKLVKAFINQKGEKIKRTHSLQELYDHAETLGLPKPPAHYIADVQCPAGVRYGEIAVSKEDASKAHIVALELCEVAAQCIALALGRDTPVIHEPLLDGLPLDQFLDKYKTISDQKDIMLKVDKQGIVTVTTNDDVTAHVHLTFYALSLTAARREGENLRVDHIASSSDAHTEEDAIKQGLDEARQKWPPSEGWEVDALAKAINLDLDLHGGKAQ